jgi:integrase
MASIHRDPRSPKGVWYAAYTTASGRRIFRSTRQRSKSKARLLADAWETAEREAAAGTLSRNRAIEIINETLARSGQAPIERISVKGWLESWLASKKANVSAASHKVYSQVVGEFFEHLGAKGAGRDLETISEIDVQGFLDAIRASGRSATTINKLRAMLSTPFAQALRAGRISYNPVAATSSAKPDATRKGIFSPEQIVALLRVAPADWRGAVLFSFTTGARLSDTAGLRWSSLDVGNGIVTYRETKTGAQAVVALHADFLNWLSTRPAPERPDAFVFPELAGKPTAGDGGLSTTFRKLIAKAGIENPLLRARNAGLGNRVRALTFHSLRHTAASSVFNSAALREITRRVTQHAAGGVLDTYLHTDLQSIREAVNLIPRLPL